MRRASKGLLLGFVALAASPSVHAEGFQYIKGGMDSGGGHALVCRNAANQITSVELFDYFEARVLDRMELKFPEGTYQEITTRLLERIPAADKDRRFEYGSASRDFFENGQSYGDVAFVRGIDLQFFDDSASSIRPPDGCRLEQLAIQREPQFDSDPKFIVDGDLWDRLSESDKAGLILHEMAYWDARQLGAKDSRRTRHFNALIASDHWSEFQGNLEAQLNFYLSDLKALRLPTTYTMRMANSNGGTVQVYLDLATALFYYSDIEAGRISSAEIDTLKYPDAMPIVPLVTCKPTFSDTRDLQAPLAQTKELRFHENGCLADVTFSVGTPELPVARFYALHRARVSAMSFDEEGTPFCAKLANDSWLVDGRDRVRDFSAGTVVFLDEEGRVTATDEPIACGI